MSEMEYHSCPFSLQRFHANKQTLFPLSIALWLHFVSKWWLAIYVVGRGGIPQGRPMMDRARREHKNDINISIIEQFCKSRHGLFKNFWYNRNIENRSVNILLRICEVTSLDLRSGNMKTNRSFLWFSLAFAKKKMLGYLSYCLTN